MPRSPWRRIARLIVGRAVLAMTVLLVVVGCDVTSSGMAIPRPRPTPAGTTVPQAGVAPPAGPASLAPASTDDGALVPASPGPTSPGPASAPAGAAGCRPGLWALIRDKIDDPAVALVGLTDNCQVATIQTSLDSANTAVGAAICRKAAEVAFANGMTSISVTAVDARRIATGTPEMGCTGAP